MLDLITRQLKANDAVHDWQVLLTHKRSHQLFLVGERVENERTVETSSAEIRIFNDHPSANGQTVRGEASFTLLPQDGESVAAQKLDEAVFMAGLVGNPMFGLPGPADYPRVEVLDTRLAGEPGAVLDELRERLVASVTREPQVRLSSSELFLDVADSQFRNSRGIETASQSSRAMVDLVLISSDGSDESEMHIAQERRRVADFDVSGLVARKATEARDALRGTLPENHKGPVLISREALQGLWSFLRTQTSAQAKFQRLSQLELGESILGERAATGEPLNLRSNSLLPFGLRSRSFDAEGLPGKDVAIVEDNVLGRFWAGQRYGEYLGVEPTGTFGNTVVPPGTTPLADLLSGGPLIHIVAFSNMRPDPVTGNVVAEIRLGYAIDGDAVTPVKGGALSTNAFDAFAQATYSQESVFLGEYQGPEAVRFAEMSVAGG